jgi:uncharacterized protein (DUF488 family)
VSVTLFTIGFTGKSAEAFFSALRTAGVRRLVDVRLRNTSQLAGFAKRDDLAFFLREVLAVEYVHRLDLAPTAELLDGYRSTRAWPEYARRFGALLAERRVEHAVDRALLDGACLLCSEPEAEHCHRRLVAEHLRAHWGDVRIEHL